MLQSYHVSTRYKILSPPFSKYSRSAPADYRFFWNSVLVQYFYYTKKKKKNPSIFIAYLVKSIHLIQQTATFTRFSSPIPATSHFDNFDFKPENDENKEIVFSSSFIEPNF